MKRRLPYLWLGTWFMAAAAVYLLDDGTLESHRLERSLRFGFDSFGRTLLPVVLKASALSALFAAAATAVATAAGIVLGSAIALTPGRPRQVFLRGLEFFLAFPYLLLALTWAAIRGPGWDTLLGALAIGTVPGFVRLMHLRAEEVLNEDYAAAARAMGSGAPGLLTRHLTPALLALSAVKTPNLFAHALIAEASLSFMGVGAPVGRDTWGTLLQQGREYLIEAPHIAFAVGLPLVLTILSLQQLSEARSDRGLRR